MFFNFYPQFVFTTSVHKFYSNNSNPSNKLFLLADIDHTPTEVRMRSDTYILLFYIEHIPVVAEA